MKANELSCKDLMIGDWVRSKKWREKPFRLTRLNDSGKYYYGITSDEKQVGPFFIEELEPILLTPEIMKKSGFKPNKVCDYIYTDSDPDIVIDMFEPNNPKYRKPLEEYLKEVGISLLQSNYLFGPLDAAIIIKAYYVHELQHFIKPCGIEREIKL